jgi:probable lipoprotein NlpC
MKMRKNIFCLMAILFAAGSVFAAVPIQDKTLKGEAAANARLRLLSAAEKLLGVPYRYAGVDRGGLDCSGFVYLSFREGLSYTVPRSSGGLYNWAEKIPDNELQPGDLVFFVTTGPGVSHLGIYVGDGRFIHSASEGPRTGVIYSRLDESYWKRTYRGAGRALPWDTEAAEAMAAARSCGISPALSLGGSAATTYQNGGTNSKNAAPPPEWKDPGFFSGFGLAWNWGGFIQGSPSVFRGLTFTAAAGYKWTKYRVGVEIRPVWDRALGVYRLPFTLSVGTDTFQIFGGPAFTIGDPFLNVSDRERHYKGEDEWRWEVGFSTAFPPIRIGRGGLSLFGELAWQPYHWEDGESFSFKPDATANVRLSTGIRYLWRVGN